MSNRDMDKEVEAKQVTHKEVIVKVFADCEGCANKLSNCLMGYNGVEEVKVDGANNKVVVKGQKVDHIKVLERIKKKYSKNAELISPKINPNDNNKKEAEKEKKKEPQIKTAVLKILMHCEGCALEIKKKIQRIKGVISVETNMEKSQVTVRGELEPVELSEKIKKQLGKHVEIVKQEQAKPKQKENNTTSTEIKYQHPPQYAYQNYMHPCHMLSDENVFACSIM